MFNLDRYSHARALISLGTLFALPYLVASWNFFNALRQFAGISQDWSAEEVLYHKGAPAFLDNPIIQTNSKQRGPLIRVPRPPAGFEFGTEKSANGLAKPGEDPLGFSSWTYAIGGQSAHNIPIQGSSDKIAPRPRFDGIPISHSFLGVSLANLRIEFNSDTALINSITCGTSEDVTSQCGPLLGLWTGDSEAQVLRLLGQPTSSDLHSGLKRLKYDDLGISIKLRLGTIEELTHSTSSIQFMGSFRRLITLWPVWLTNPRRPAHD